MPKFLKIILAKFIGFYINLLSYIMPDKALGIAYQFFSEPRGGKLNSDKLPDILKEATSETVQLNNQYFQTYTWHGNTTKILLIHGWESNAARWEKLLVFLKKSGSTIIAIDAPAHGMSGGKEFSVPAYGAFINAICELHHPKFIIGHSMGGISAAYYQHHYNSKHVEKMVLLGTPADFKVLLHNYINTLGLNLKVYDLLQNYIRQRFNIVIDDFSAQQFLKNTQIQGFIAHDRDDTVVDIEEAQKLAASWKTARFIETKGLGHSLHDDLLYKNIYQFLFEAK
jgi:pimeloyl-ACP methyl ester carboxylesterase